MDKLEIINAYVTANEKRLKNTCFKVSKGHQDWQDLFSEFYLRVIETKDAKFQRYSISQLCYWTIVEVWQNRNRHNMKTFKWSELDNVRVGVEPEQHFDLMDFIENKISGKNFAPVMTFVLCTDTSLTKVSKATSINTFQLSMLRNKGAKQIKSFLGKDYMLTQ